MSVTQAKAMTDRFWKSMPAALKEPTLDELNMPFRDFDHSQVDERVGILLNAILQLESQGEGRESATEEVLLVGYTSDGISNQQKTSWLSWNIDGGLRGFELERNPGLSNSTEYSAGEFPLPTRPTVRTGSHSSSKALYFIRPQQKEGAYADLSMLKRELKKVHRERDQANLNRDKATIDRDQAVLKKDKVIPERDLLRVTGEYSKL